MEIAFARENLGAVWDEVQPLLQAHWREIAHYQDIPLDVDVQTYAQIEAAGVLRIFTVRVDGRLAGYNCFMVKAHPHYRCSLQANQDVLFLAPDFRGAGVGIRFIDWCDGELAAEGVQVVYQHVKAAHNFGPLLERLGYELMDLIYARRLDHGHDSAIDSRRSGSEFCALAGDGAERAASADDPATARRAANA